MEIRESTINDIPDLVGLMEQLGYPTTIEKMKLRFNAILSNSSYRTLVAELNGKVIAMAGLSTGIFYEHDGSFVRIAALVVDSNYRGKGIGKKLIQDAESWAREQGAISMGLNSGNREERENAHQFYLNLGYEAKSTGFTKILV